MGSFIKTLIYPYNFSIKTIQFLNMLCHRITPEYLLPTPKIFFYKSYFTFQIATRLHTPVRHDNYDPNSHLHFIINAKTLFCLAF